MKMYECNFCKDMFIARDLFPCKTIAADRSIHTFVLCRVCLTDFEETETMEYIDEFEKEDPGNEFAEIDTFLDLLKRVNNAVIREKEYIDEFIAIN